MFEGFFVCEMNFRMRISFVVRRIICQGSRGVAFEHAYVCYKKKAPIWQVRPVFWPCVTFSSALLSGKEGRRGVEKMHMNSEWPMWNRSSVLSCCSFRIWRLLDCSH